MGLTPGLQLGTGLQPTNPIPTDSWAGPYADVAEANASVPAAVRFEGREVIIFDGIRAKIYGWYVGIADGDLEESASGGSATPGEGMGLDGNGDIALGAEFGSDIPITSARYVTLAAGSQMNFAIAGTGTGILGIINDGTISGVQIQANDLVGGVDYFSLLLDYGNGAVFSDFRPTPIGIVYAADYSASYTDRSLVDKEYVDNAVGGGGAFWPLTGTAVLTGAVSIEAGSNPVELGTTGDPFQDLYIRSAGTYLMQGSAMEIQANSLVVLTGSTNINSAGFVNIKGNSDNAVNGVSIAMGDLNEEGAPTIYHIGMSYTNGMVVTDDNNTGGLKYAADYSANYTNRSLVDKEYVDNATGGGGAFWPLAGSADLTGDVQINGGENYGINLGYWSGQSLTTLTVYASHIGLNTSSGGTLSFDSDAEIMQLIAPSNGFVLTGNVRYSADFSASFTDRSLVDKGYVDNVVIGGGLFIFESGLTNTAGTVRLGGILTQDVTIDGLTNGHFISMSGTSWSANAEDGTTFTAETTMGNAISAYRRFSFDTTKTGGMEINTTTASLNLYSTDSTATRSANIELMGSVGEIHIGESDETVFINLGNINGTDYSYITTYGVGKNIEIAVGNNGTGFTSINLHEDSFVITGSHPTFEGVKYAADYSTNFVARSLVDKAYVDNVVIGGGLFIFENGLTNTAGTVTLGGNINQNTAIDGTFDLRFGNTIRLANFSVDVSGDIGFSVYDGVAGNPSYFQINPSTLLIDSGDGIVKIYSAGANGVEIGEYGATTIFSNSGPVVLRTGTSSMVFTMDNNTGFDPRTTFTDGRPTTYGIEYAADYSSGFTERSLVDKAYVDASTNSWPLDGTRQLTGSGTTILGDGDTAGIRLGILGNTLETFRVTTANARFYSAGALSVSNWADDFTTFSADPQGPFVIRPFTSLTIDIGGDTGAAGYVLTADGTGGTYWGAGGGGGGGWPLDGSAMLTGDVTIDGGSGSSYVVNIGSNTNPLREFYVRTVDNNESTITMNDDDGGRWEYNNNTANRSSFFSQDGTNIGIFGKNGVASSLGAVAITFDGSGFSGLPGIELYYINTTAGGSLLNLTQLAIIASGNDEDTFQGIIYGEDYSANYTNRSLVDKEYVDNAVAGGGGGGHIIQDNGSPLPQRANLNILNGLTAADDAGNDATTIQLGGVMTSNITITGTPTMNYVTTLDDSTTYRSLLAMYGSSAMTFNESYNYVSTELSQTSLTPASWNASTDVGGVGGSIATYAVGVRISLNGGTTFEYDDDYSANFTARSLVDKAYVDNVVIGGGLFIFESGLTNTAGTVRLGGNLTQDAVINGVGNVLELRNTVAGIGSLVEINASQMQLTYTNPTTEITSLYVADGLMLIDSVVPAFAGATYAGDYSTNFVDRSLTDVGYVKNNFLQLQAQTNQVVVVANNGVSYREFMLTTMSNSTPAIYVLDDVGGAYSRFGGGSSGVNGFAHLQFDIDGIAGPAAVKFYDSRPITKGIEYDADYSSGFTTRSLVDKAYVDNVVIGGGLFVFDSGLTNTAGNVRLGGVFLENIVFNGADTYSVSFNSLTSFGITTASGIGLSDVVGVEQVTVNVQSIVGGLNIQDERTTPTGMEYAADYSANYTNRSLVDKEYVDNAVAGGGGGSTASNGLNAVGSDIRLGGALTETTVVGNITTGGLAFDTDGSIAGAGFAALWNGDLNQFTTGSGGDVAYVSPLSTTLAQMGVRTDVNDLRSIITSNTGSDNAITRMTAGAGTGLILGDLTLEAHLTNGFSILVTSLDTSFAGIEYQDDWSANYTARSLVDKAYVDSVAGGGGAWGEITADKFTWEAYTANKQYGYMFGTQDRATYNTPWDGSDSHAIEGEGIERFTVETSSGQGFIGLKSHFYYLSEGWYYKSQLNIAASQSISMEKSGINGYDFSVNPTTGGYKNLFDLDKWEFSSYSGDTVYTSVMIGYSGGLKYGADYSGSFTDRSLVDKAWVLSQIGGGGSIPPPQNNNKDMNPTATSGDEASTGLTITSTPTGLLIVIVDGVAFRIGDGVKTKDCYFSDDAGATAKALSAIVAGDELYWNGVIAGADLAVTNSIDFYYI